MTTRFARCNDNAIRHYQRETGGHYFDADTLKYFGSRVGMIFEADETLELPALIVVSNAARLGPSEYRVLGGRRYYFVVGITPEGQLIDADDLGVPHVGSNPDSPRGWLTATGAENHARKWLARMTDDAPARYLLRVAQLTERIEAAERAERRATEARITAGQALAAYRAKEGANA